MTPAQLEAVRRAAVAVVAAAPASLSDAATLYPSLAPLFVDIEVLRAALYLWNPELDRVDSERVL